MRAPGANRRTLILLGILIVLIASYLLGLVLSPERVHQREAQAPLLPGLDLEAVREVRVHREGQPVRLLRSESQQWQIVLDERGFPGHGRRTTAFLDQLASLQRRRVVALERGAWEALGVGLEPDGRVEVLAAGGRPLADLLVGRRGPEGKGTYVRLAGSSEALLTDGSLRFYLDAGASYWSELRLFPESLNAELVNSIEVVASILLSPGDERRLDYALRRGAPPSGGWRLQRRGDIERAASPVEAERLANAAVTMAGTDFALGVSDQQAGLSTPQAMVRFETSDGRWHSILVGAAAGDDHFYLAAGGGDYLYRAAGWRLDLLLQRPEELVAGLE